ncbi:MAG: cbb3-type cytochrome c oxidase subunit 3 [Paracoccaceae bacterium]|nr:cbb3-type cytochrome c oxidase subunit 3 [Paracoccaceae bacterium]
MESLTLWEQIAASKTVIWMFLAFAVFVGFAFRPGSGKAQRDSAESIFRNEDRPAGDAGKEEVRQ